MILILFFLKKKKNKKQNKQFRKGKSGFLSKLGPLSQSLGPIGFNFRFTTERSCYPIQAQQAEPLQEKALNNKLRLIYMLFPFLKIMKFELS